MRAETDPDPEPEASPYSRAVRLSALAVIAVGAIVLIGGWVFDVRALRTVIPGAVGMKPLTALLLACGGIALLLVAPEGISARRARLGRVAATAPGLLAALVLGEMIFGWNLGIDEWPFVDHDGRAAGIATPGRFAPPTGVCFVVLTAALLSLDAGCTGRWRPSELFALPMAIVSLMGLIGYTYSIPAFYGPGSATKMAFHTAACFVALAVGILLARPRGRLLAMATTTDPGGVTVRRLLPLATVGPLILGWLHLKTVGAWDVFDLEVGTWWLSVATIGGLGAMIWWCAASLSRADDTRRQLETRLYELANHDELTGLVNRRRFDEDLASFIAYGRRYGRPGALVVLDLNEFKQVNDVRGHVAGDRLLAAVGRALVERARITDTVARMGGDEFAVILREIDADDATRVAEELVVALSELILAFGDEPVTITASAGVAHVEDFSDLDAERLLGRADAAMYVAKGDGRRSARPSDVEPPASRVIAV